MQEPGGTPEPPAPGTLLVVRLAGAVSVCCALALPVVAFLGMLARPLPGAPSSAEQWMWRWLALAIAVLGAACGAGYVRVIEIPEIRGARRGASCVWQLVACALAVCSTVALIMTLEIIFRRQ